MQPVQAFNSPVDSKVQPFPDGKMIRTLGRQQVILGELPGTRSRMNHVGRWRFGQPFSVLIYQAKACRHESE